MDRQKILEQFVLDNYGIVKARALRRVGNHPDADDLAQEAFLSILHPTFDLDRADSPGFVNQSACYRGMDRLRRLSRAPKALPLDLADQRARGPDQALEQKEDRERARRLILDAIGSLPARDQEMVLGYYGRARSADDLALSFGLARQTVRGVLCRAKKAILAWLGLGKINNSAMKTLVSFAVAAMTRDLEGVEPYPSSEEVPMSYSNRDNGHNPTPEQPRFPKPDKVERDTLIARRRTLRAAIAHLCGLGWNPARHDQMMVVLNNRSDGRIPAEECDRRWAAFAREFGLDA
jgi:RNA polymerase sigma factor (sigma-70 family)